MRVETLLLQIGHKKRKDVSSPIMQMSFGTCEVALNPKEDDDDEVRELGNFMHSASRGGISGLTGGPGNSVQKMILIYLSINVKSRSCFRLAFHLKTLANRVFNLHSSLTLNYLSGGVN